MRSVEKFELPDQAIPDSKKDMKWHMNHGNSMVMYLNKSAVKNKNGYLGRNSAIRDLELQYLAEPIDRETLTKPYGFESGQDYSVYPLIEGIIDDIVGKYLSRPLKRKLYSINRKSINSILDTKMDYVVESLLREVNEKLSKQAGVDIETPNPDLELPDDIEEFFSKSFKTNEEELGDDLITQFLEVNKYKNKIKYALTEYLYGDTCALNLDVKNGHPSLEYCRYDETYYDVDIEKEVQDDMEVFATFKRYTQNEIYNNFILSKKQKDKVKQRFAEADSGDILMDEIQDRYAGGFDGVFQNCSKGVSYKGWIDENTHDTKRLRVLSMKWKSRRQIRSKKYTNKKGETRITLLPEKYKERSGDDITIDEIETIHHVKMLGPEIMLSYGELEERNSFIDAPAKARISSVGLIGKTYLKGSKIRSVAAKLKGLQRLASDMLFQIEDVVNSIDGKVLLYDAAQTPKHFIDTYGPENAINRVLHDAKKDNLVVINSKDKGSRNTFNQFSSYDLSNRGKLKDLTEGLMLVEDLSRKFVGLTKESQQGGEKYQTATGVNHSIIAANNRIEVIYEPFDALMGEVLNKYLAKAKHVYPESKAFPIIFGDNQTKFLTISKEFKNNSDLGVYIGDTSKDIRDKQAVDMGTQQLLGTVQDISMVKELINVLQADSATEANGILDRAMAQLEKKQAEANEAAQANEEANRQAEAQKLEQEAQKHKEQLQNNIDVANIYNQGKINSDGMKVDADLRKTAATLESDQLLADKKINADNNKESSSSKSSASPKSSGTAKPTDDNKNDKNKK